MGTGEGRVLPVLGGPLRGATLAVPALERPSYLLGTYEPHVVKAVEATLRPGDVAYDAGAHVGYHALVMARRVGAHGTVLAFEPDPRNRRLLERNLRVNGATWARVDARALADRPGEHLFATYGYSSVGHLFHGSTRPDARLHRVSVTTLDALVFAEGQPPPRLVKIDVEGAEGLVLRGADRLLAECRPVLVVEVRPGPILEAVLDRLNRHGYVWRPADRRQTSWRTHTRTDLLCVPTEQATSYR